MNSDGRYMVTSNRFSTNGKIVLWPMCSQALTQAHYYYSGCCSAGANRFISDTREIYANEEFRFDWGFEIVLACFPFEASTLRGHTYWMMVPTIPFLPVVWLPSPFGATHVVDGRISARWPGA